jgi:hypothetical protein
VKSTPQDGWAKQRQAIIDGNNREPFLHDVKEKKRKLRELKEAAQQ